MPLPSVEPMRPTQLPRAFHHEGWVYEEKVDGYRVLAHKDGERVRLISRHAKDLTARFPELAETIRTMRADALILAGEVAVYDEQLVSRFEWMRRPPQDAIATPPMMMVFDRLRLEGQDVRHEPLRIRRDRVERVLDGPPAVLLPVRRLADHGLKAWQEVLERGYEGLVAKDPASPYVGGRTLQWLKVKQPKYREGERGWEPNRKS
jgi:bifunctional non-homologous end joining protein LigD